VAMQARLRSHVRAAVLTVAVWQCRLVAHGMNSGAMPRCGVDRGGVAMQDGGCSRSHGCDGAAAVLIAVVWRCRADMRPTARSVDPAPTPIPVVRRCRGIVVSRRTAPSKAAAWSAVVGRCRRRPGPPRARRHRGCGVECGDRAMQERSTRRLINSRCTAVWSPVVVRCGARWWCGAGRGRGRRVGCRSGSNTDPGRAAMQRLLSARQ
jgi:hypothetical protein